MDDPGGERVDEVAVVADDDDGAFVAVEGVKEYLAALHVEVVGGLVEEQQVARPEQHLGEGGAVALAAAQYRNLLLGVITREEEGAEDAAAAWNGVEGGVGLHLLEQGVAERERLHLVLREVGEDDVVTELDAALVGRHHGGDQLEKRGLAGAVGSDDDDALAPLHLYVDVAVDLEIAVALGHMLHAERNLSGGRRGREAEGDGAALLDDLDAIDLLELLDAALDLLGLGGLGAEAFDELLGLTDGAVLALFLLQNVFEADGAGLDVVVEVAGVDLEAVGVEGCDLGADAVEEVAVVRDENDGSVVAVEEVLEPLDARQVEVVGGFVEEQDRGPLDEQPSERETNAPAAGELGGALREAAGREAEAAEDDGGVGAEGVAAAGLVALLDGAEFVGDDLHLGLGGAGRAEGVDAGGEHLHLLLGLDEFGAAAEGVVEHREVVHVADLLREESDGGAGGGANTPGIGLHLPCDNAEEGGLTGAVRADESDPHTRPELPVEVAEEGSAAEGAGQPFYLKHGAP